jgi:RimJ/RimL family protein N-acetyltransferase
LIGELTLIQTERLLLRPHTMDDLDAMYALTSHPEVYQFDPGRKRSLEETRDILEFRILELRRRDIGRLAVVLRETNQLIGYIGLQLCLLDGTPYNYPGIEFFYGLAREHWGQGYITEGGRALLKHGFEVHRLPKIVSTAQTLNLRSIAVMRRLGMTVRADPVDPLRWVLGEIDNPR